MLKNTPYAQRPYDVFVQGPERTLDESRRAAKEYVDSLEVQLGAPWEVARCFCAWEREMEDGILGMTRAEINGAAAWRAAHHTAFQHASRPPMVSGILEIIFVIKQAPCGAL